MSKKEKSLKRRFKDTSAPGVPVSQEELDRLKEEAKTKKLPKSPGAQEDKPVKK